VENLFAGAVVATAFVASLLWALIVPYHHAPDEAAHFNMAWFIAVHNQLPIYDQSPDIHHTTCDTDAGPCYGSYASLPPGGPLLGAALMKLQHALTGQSYDDLIFPVRLASALCIGVYVLFLYLISRALLQDRFVRLSAVMIGAFIPQVTFLGGYANDDAIGLAAGAILLYLTIALLRDGLQRRTALLTGVSLGVLALAKVNYYSVLLPFGLCALARLGREWRAGRAKRFLGLLTLASVVGAAICGWWFVRSHRLYDDPIGVSVFYRSFYAAAPGYKAYTIAGQGGTILSMLRNPATPWWQKSFVSFWGLFDHMNVLLAPEIYGWIFMGMIVSLLGLLPAGFTCVASRRGGPRDGHWRVQIWLALAGLIAVATFQSLWTSLTHAFQPQGRYLYPGLIPIVLFLAVGVHGWSSRRGYRALAFGCVALAMLCLNVHALMFVIVPTYYNWPGK